MVKSREEYPLNLLRIPVLFLGLQVLLNRKRKLMLLTKVKLLLPPRILLIKIVFYSILSKQGTLPKLRVIANFLLLFWVQNSDVWA